MKQQYKALVIKAKKELPKIKELYEKNKFKYKSQNVQFGILIDGVLDYIVKTPKGWFLELRFAKDGTIFIDNILNRCKCDSFKIKRYKLESI